MTTTHDGSRAVLSILWGTRALAGRTSEAVRWYRALIAAIDGAVVEDVALG
jgi:hypothetical protein